MIARPRSRASAWLPANAAYARLADDPLREASERIGATISAALDGNPPAEVVPLRNA